MKILLFLIASFFGASFSYSQSSQNDSLSDLKIKDAIDLYNHFSADNAPVYNGSAYIYLTYKMEGDPYFITGDFTDGWVNYSGREYDSVLLMFDLARNQLVILAPDRDNYFLKRIPALH